MMLKLRLFIHIVGIYISVKCEITFLCVMILQSVHIWMIFHMRVSLTELRNLTQSPILLAFQSSYQIPQSV